MKAKIVVIIALIILTALSVFAVKKFIDNSVVDKNGMIREFDDVSMISSDASDDNS